MEKLLTVVLASSLLLLATLAGHASSRSFLHPSALDTQRGHVLGRKGREEPAYPHYRREGELKEQHEVAAMEVKIDAERKDGRGEEEDEDARAVTEGLISSEDYSGVAMHDRSSPPAHKKKKHP
ncbi:uncharacterized protein LOC124679318 [Lolium rigidum]|uniref:uncharacterized protein LOC124679318 n=1 Tax=Lolium rigidum TaxID=89674 RepID=UPI001F5CDC1E|nr:uncharacterized protein LOC124679318 [Lolium rigidum]